MAGPETQRESAERLPDFEALAGKLADALSETKNPAILTVLKNTLTFLDKPDQTKQELNSEVFDQIKTYIAGLKNAPEKVQILRNLSTKEDIDPDLKRLVAELLKYLNGEKTIEEAQSAETAQPGAGIPISAPTAPVETNPDSGDDTAEHPDERLEQELAEVSETDESPAEDQIDQTDNDSGSATETTKSDASKRAESRQMVDNLQNFEQEVKKMSMGEIVKKFIEMAKSLPDLLKGITEKLTGGASAPAYTADQIKESTPDFSRVNEAEPIASDNKNVEYVARVLNLPVKPNAEEFLAALKQSPDCVFETEKEVSKLKAGDVLFFHDGQDKGKTAVTSIVSEAGPPAKMKLVNEGGNVQEVEIEQSSLLNNWLGYIRMPQSQSGESQPLA